MPSPSVTLVKEGDDFRTIRWMETIEFPKSMTVRANKLLTVLV